MTNEDIIRMAREALKEDDGEDYYAYTHQIIHWWGKEDEIIKFANLIAAAEREACAKVCEDSVPTYTKDGERWLKGRNGKPDVRLKDLAPNLEAALEQEQLLRKNSALKDIATGHILATAIRARSNHD